MKSGVEEEGRDIRVGVQSVRVINLALILSLNEIPFCPGMRQRGWGEG